MIQSLCFIKKYLENTSLPRKNLRNRIELLDRLCKRIRIRIITIHRIYHKNNMEVVETRTRLESTVIIRITIIIKIVRRIIEV